MQRKQEHRTTMVRPDQVKREWYQLDATGKTLGRFCAEVAKILRGKHKPSFTPHIDMGDGVVIINANRIVVTGAKEAQKIYRYHTGYVGNMREIPYRNMMARDPEYIIRHAVAGMMPKSRLGKQQLRKLRIFAGSEHPHEAQQVIKVEV